MNREIKFRAWDGENKKMLSVFEPDEQGKREYYPFVVPVGFSHFDKSTIILLQFTGLKDADNTEIYEGDVIIRRGMENAWVEFDHGEYVLRHDTPKAEFRQSLKQTFRLHIKVGGNIYQNPDLIQQV